MAVPTPNSSIGAPDSISFWMRYSSRLPLAKILTSSEALPVEEAARLDTEIGEVAAVETYGLQPVAVALEFERYMRSVLTPRTVS